MSFDRKKEIIAAAGKCFIKFGYDKTTLDDIAEIVGINKASFYYYFENKEAIFHDLIISEADDYIEKLKKKVASIDGCREKILSWIKEGFKYDEANSILRQLSLDSLRKLSPILFGLQKYAKEKGKEYLSSVLTYFEDKGQIKTNDPDKVAQAIQNIIYTFKDNAYHYTQNTPDGIAGKKKLEEEILFTVSLILDGIIV